MTRKWNIVNDNSNANYGVGNEINYDKEVILLYIRGHITVGGAPRPQVAFKNCVPFTKYITKIDGATIAAASNFYLVMLM